MNFKQKNLIGAYLVVKAEKVSWDVLYWGWPF